VIANAYASHAADMVRLPPRTPISLFVRKNDGFMISCVRWAARRVVSCAAGLLGWTDEQVCARAGIQLLLDSSIKRALDIDWDDTGAKTEAIRRFSRQLDALQEWIARRLREEIGKPPLKDSLDTLVQIRTQDLEPDPQGGASRIGDGVAVDRRVSIEDREMRHGRKSHSKRFNGFKRHIATDLDGGLIVACAITPANRPEAEAMPSLTTDPARQGLDVDQLVIDRGYINSTLVDDVLRRVGSTSSYRGRAGQETIGHIDRSTTIEPVSGPQHECACPVLTESRRATRMARLEGRKSRPPAPSVIIHRPVAAVTV
jgi:hypothetical protein